MKTERIPYEILLRFNRAGFQGAHVIDAVQVREDDGTFLSESLLPARPVSEAEVGAVIGGTAARLIQSADAARAERDKAREDLDLALSERTALKSHVQELLAQMAKAGLAPKKTNVVVDGILNEHRRKGGA